jgi:uncharacterized protein with HEPN domain
MNSPLLKDERNKQIYQDRLNGMSYRDLMKKYDLALSRLQAIVDREAGRSHVEIPSEYPPTETYEPAYILEKLRIHVSRILSVSPGMTLDQFKSEWPMADALVFGLERVSKGVQLLPQDWKEQHPEVDWARLAKLQPSLVTRYWDVDYQDCWEVITDELPKLQSAIA